MAQMAQIRSSHLVSSKEGNTCRTTTQDTTCGEEGLVLDDRGKKIRKVQKTERTYALSYLFSYVHIGDETRMDSDI